MTGPLYLLMIVGMVLVVCVFFFWRDARRRLDEESQDTDSSAAWDPLVSELGAKLFDAKDTEFVGRQCPQELARRFRAERTELALDWLSQLRKHANLLMREHARGARSDSNLKPADELKLALEFLLFQVSSGILYLTIWMFGPLRASRLVGYPVALAQELHKMTDVIAPTGAQVAAELLDMDASADSRTAAR
jgi:hypothetical protein